MQQRQAQPKPVSGLTSALISGPVAVPIPGPERCSSPEVMLERSSLPEVMLERGSSPEVIPEHGSSPEVILQRSSSPEVVLQRSSSLPLMGRPFFSKKVTRLIWRPDLIGSRPPRRSASG